MPMYPIMIETNLFKESKINDKTKMRVIKEILKDVVRSLMKL